MPNYENIFSIRKEYPSVGVLKERKCIFQHHIMHLTSGTVDFYLSPQLLWLIIFFAQRSEGVP